MSFATFLVTLGLLHILRYNRTIAILAATINDSKWRMGALGPHYGTGAERELNGGRRYDFTTVKITAHNSILYAVTANRDFIHLASTKTIVTMTTIQISGCSSKLTLQLPSLTNITKQYHTCFHEIVSVIENHNTSNLRSLCHFDLIEVARP